MINLSQGRILKEKIEFLRERFTTRSGLIDLLAGTAIWGFFVKEYSLKLLLKIEQIIGNSNFFLKYITLVIFGTILSLVGLGISIAIIKTYHFIRKNILSPH